MTRASSHRWSRIYPPLKRGSRRTLLTNGRGNPPTPADEQHQRDLDSLGRIERQLLERAGEPG